MTSEVIHSFDLFGTAVFAITGALCGVHHRLDLLGVVVFGCTVGVGGGILRDTIIGAVPAAALKDLHSLHNQIRQVRGVMHSALSMSSKGNELE